MIHPMMEVVVHPVKLGGLSVTSVEVAHESEELKVTERYRDGRLSGFLIRMQSNG